MPANVTIITETMDERTAQYLGQIHNVSVVYNIYRIVLPLVLLVSSLGPSPTLFIQACTAYALFGAAASFFIPIGTRVLKSSYILTGSLIKLIFLPLPFSSTVVEA
jgi:hypothetical protein